MRNLSVCTNFITAIKRYGEFSIGPRGYNLVPVTYVSVDLQEGVSRTVAVVGHLPGRLSGVLYAAKSPGDTAIAPRTLL